jgi:hypothetical protein
MELRAIRGSMDESPPPPPAGITVREWFAGLALMNGELMKDLSPAERVVEAVRLADDLIKALNPPRVPSQESMAAPSEKEISEWSDRIVHKREAKIRQGCASVPATPAAKQVRLKTAAYSFSGVLPPPMPEKDPASAASACFQRANDALKRPTLRPSPVVIKEPSTPGVGRYSMIPPSQLNAEELGVE